MLDKIIMFLASKGWFSYDGGSWRLPPRYPIGRVVYPDGATSALMPLGNAFSYSRIFGGKVERIRMKR